MRRLAAAADRKEAAPAVPAVVLGYAGRERYMQHGRHTARPRSTRSIGHGSQAKRGRGSGRAQRAGSSVRACSMWRTSARLLEEAEANDQ